MHQLLGQRPGRGFGRALSVSDGGEPHPRGPPARPGARDASSRAAPAGGRRLCPRPGGPAPGARAKGRAALTCLSPDGAQLRRGVAGGAGAAGTGRRWSVPARPSQELRTPKACPVGRGGGCGWARESGPRGALCGAGLPGLVWDRGGGGGGRGLQEGGHEGGGAGASRYPQPRGKAPRRRRPNRSPPGLFFSSALLGQDLRFLGRVCGGAV